MVHMLLLRCWVISRAALAAGCVWLMPTRPSMDFDNETEVWDTKVWAHTCVCTYEYVCMHPHLVSASDLACVVGILQDSSVETTKLLLHTLIAIGHLRPDLLESMSALETLVIAVRQGVLRYYRENTREVEMGGSTEEQQSLELLLLFLTLLMDVLSPDMGMEEAELGEWWFIYRMCLLLALLVSDASGELLVARSLRLRSLCVRACVRACVRIVLCSILFVHVWAFLPKCVLQGCDTHSWISWEFCSQLQ